MAKEDENVEKLPLSQAAQHLLEECRMVLPGIQALFGFQLIAVLLLWSMFPLALGIAQLITHSPAIALSLAIALPSAYLALPAPASLRFSGRAVL